MGNRKYRATQVKNLDLASLNESWVVVGDALLERLGDIALSCVRERDNRERLEAAGAGKMPALHRSARAPARWQRQALPGSSRLCLR